MLTEAERAHLIAEGARIEAEDRLRWESLEPGMRSFLPGPVINPVMSEEEKARWQEVERQPSNLWPCGTVACDLSGALQAERIICDFIGEEDFERFRSNADAMWAALRMALDRMTKETTEETTFKNSRGVTVTITKSASAFPDFMKRRPKPK